MVWSDIRPYQASTSISALTLGTRAHAQTNSRVNGKINYGKATVAITPEECLGQATVRMNEVEQPDCCKYYSEQSFNEIILISLVRKFPFFAILGQDWPLLATIGLEDSVTD